MFFRHAPAGFHYMLTDVCDLLVTAFGDYRPSTFEQRNQAVDFILHLIKVRLIPAHTCGDTPRLLHRMAQEGSMLTRSPPCALISYRCPTATGCPSSAATSTTSATS
jgi:hypothetical protein